MPAGDSVTTYTIVCNKAALSSSTAMASSTTRCGMVSESANSAKSVFAGSTALPGKLCDIVVQVGISAVSSDSGIFGLAVMSNSAAAAGCVEPDVFGATGNCAALKATIRGASKALEMALDVCGALSGRAIYMSCLTVAPTVIKIASVTWKNKCVTSAVIATRGLGRVGAGVGGRLGGEEACAGRKVGIARCRNST